MIGWPKLVVVLEEQGGGDLWTGKGVGQGGGARGGGARKEIVNGYRLTRGQ